MIDWTDAERAPFVAMQFDAQDRSYRSTFPSATFSVVTTNGAPIGRLYLDRVDDAIRIIDITIASPFRGAGIGSSLLARVIAAADADGLPVRLHVDNLNPARRLYERLGFRAVSKSAFGVLMEWPPTTASRTRASPVS